MPMEPFDVRRRASPPEPLASPRGSKAGFALVCLLLVPWALGLVPGLDDRIWGGGAVWPWLTLPPLAVLVALARPSWWGTSRSSRVFAAVALGSFAPGLFVALALIGARTSLGGEDTKAMQSRPALMICALVIGGVVALLLGLLDEMAGPGKRAWQRRWMPHVAWGSVLLGASLLIAGGLRLRQNPLPYVASLVATPLPEGKATEADGIRISEHDVILPDHRRLIVTRECVSGGCRVLMRLPGGENVASPHTLPDGPTQLLRDPRSMLAVLRSVAGGPRGALEGPRDVVLDVESATFVKATLRGLGPALAPPHFWLASAGVGLVAGLGLLWRGRRWARLAKVLRGGQTATLKDGWVRMEGGEEMAAPAGQALPEGPVTVLYGEQGEAYRGGGSVEVVAGSRGNNVARAEGRVMWHQATAAAILLVMAAPLAAAVWLRLL